MPETGILPTLVYFQLCIRFLYKPEPTVEYYRGGRCNSLSPFLDPHTHPAPPCPPLITLASSSESSRLIYPRNFAPDLTLPPLHHCCRPEDDSHFFTSASNTLGLDLAADSFGASNQASFPTHSSHHGQLPNGSSVENNSYGSAAVPENVSTIASVIPSLIAQEMFSRLFYIKKPSRPTLAHLDTSLSHSLSRSPINSGLHSSSFSSTNNSPIPFLREDLDIMRPSYTQQQQQMWGSGGSLSSPDPHWDLLSYNRSSPSMHNLSPLSTSSYLAVDHSPPSSISSPGSQASPLGGSHYPTPSPRQEAPPLTPQSVSSMHSGVRIQSSPSHYPMYFPEGPPTGNAGNAMDVHLTYPPLLTALPSGSSTYMNPNSSFEQMSLYTNRPQPTHYNTSPAGFGSGMMGGPYQHLTCNPNHVLGPATGSIEVPQTRYRPHTSSDQRRYVDEIQLQAPIKFYINTSDGLKPGIPLRDAITSKFMRLEGRDEQLFQGCGPSISVRLSVRTVHFLPICCVPLLMLTCPQWTGYQPWSRQIPTRDFRSPPGPITKSKLAKNVAKSVQRFIEVRDISFHFSGPSAKSSDVGAQRPRYGTWL